MTFYCQTTAAEGKTEIFRKRNQTNAQFCHPPKFPLTAQLLLLSHTVRPLNWASLTMNELWKIVVDFLLSNNIISWHIRTQFNSVSQIPVSCSLEHVKDSSVLPCPGWLAPNPFAQALGLAFYPNIPSAARTMAVKEDMERVLLPPPPPLLLQGFVVLISVFYFLTNYLIESFSFSYARQPPKPSPCPKSSER